MTLTQVAIETESHEQAETIAAFLQDVLVEAEDTEPKYEETDNGVSVNLVVDERQFLQTFGQVVASDEKDLADFIREEALDDE